MAQACRDIVHHCSQVGVCNGGHYYTEGPQFSTERESFSPSQGLRTCYLQPYHLPSSCVELQFHRLVPRGFSCRLILISWFARYRGHEVPRWPWFQPVL